MRTVSTFNWGKIACRCVLAIAAAITVERAYGLRMTKMPAQLQTKVAEPRDRAIFLKLPLLQPDFHWSFLNREDFLAGKLTLQIIRAGKSTTITIVDNGKFSEGWEPLPLCPVPKPGKIYFGFQSSKKFPTAPGDRLKIEFQVKKDLGGIGPTQTGVLPAGTYTAEGGYSGLLDDYAVPDFAKNLPEEKISKLRQLYEFKAFLVNWESQWPLRITGDEGWLSPAQRKQFEKTLKGMREADAKK